MGSMSSDLMGLLLAENVANADTPGYKGKDLPAFTFDDALRNTGITMVSTHPNDIIPASMSGVNARTVRNEPFDVVPSGNSVDLEQEMTKISETSVDYQAVTSIYHKIKGLFNIALKGSA